MFVFLLAFFLVYIIWIPISVSKLLYFSRTIPSQMTENIDIHTETVFILLVLDRQTVFLQQMGQRNIWDRQIFEILP